MSKLTDVEVEAVRSWLGRHEFELVSSVGGDSAAFGDFQDVWERDGTLVRVTRDRGQWRYDLSRIGAGVWLDVDRVAGALGSKWYWPFERVADVTSSIDDRVFGALTTVVPPSP